MCRDEGTEVRITDDKTKQIIGELPGRMRRKGRPIKVSELDSNGIKSSARD